MLWRWKTTFRLFASPRPRPVRTFCCHDSSKSGHAIPVTIPVTCCGIGMLLRLGIILVLPQIVCRYGRRKHYRIHKRPPFVCHCNVHRLRSRNKPASDTQEFLKYPAWQHDNGPREFSLSSFHETRANTRYIIKSNIYWIPASCVVCEQDGQLTSSSLEYTDCMPSDLVDTPVPGR